MKKLTRAPSRCALALAVGLVFATPAAYGAGLGRISIQSALGQPLRAEVEVTSVGREEAASLAVRLASAAAFRQANLEFNPALTGLRVALERRGDGNYVVRITSPAPVNEPYLDLLLELNSASGRVLREYTVLLDPPALRAAPEVIPPVAGRAAPAPAQAAAPAAPRPAAAPAIAGGATYEVKRGDTLGSIAGRTKPPAASLDQMLVALFRSNPDAFIGNNMNNLRSGSVLKVPAESEVLAVEGGAARREVAAQSADFNRYRSRLAQAATGVGPAAAAAAGQGRITTRVEDGSAAAATGDQLKIAQSAAPAARAGDEAVARDRQLKELLDRVAELERTNQQLQKALELQSKSGAQAQAVAEGKAAAPEQAPAAAPPATAAAPAATAPATPAAEPPKAEPPKAAAPKAEPPKPAPPAEEPGFLAGLMGSNLPWVAGIGVVLAGLIGLGVYRRRKGTSAREDFDAAGEAARGNSLFGQTGGRSVDTGAASTFNSSFVTGTSQLDSTEVDPVAEADVYIAYGREEQAEDILKEALRLQPDRHAARVKLMEILARRGDKAAFARHAEDLKARTAGQGEDWERAAAMGRSLDPANPLFAGSAAAKMEMANRGPTTELRLGPATTGRSPADTQGVFAPPATLGLEHMSTEFQRQFTEPTPSQMPRKGQESVLPADSQFGVDSVLPLEPSTGLAAPTTRGAASQSPAGEPTDMAPLEFEALNTMPATKFLDAGAPPAVDAPAKFEFDLPPAAPMPHALPPMPDLDLNLPPAGAPKAEPAPAVDFGDFDFSLPTGKPSRIDAGPTTAGPTTGGGRRARPAPLEDALSRPSLLGDLNALPEETPTRMASNTDQATVPLIDFDLTGSDLPLNTGSSRMGTPTGSPMASQMATKLDLARGYIDLGVRDGARELLEEVMRDGTREQRQAAVELMKQIER